MDNSIRRKKKIKSVILISLIGIIVGSVFSVFAFGFTFVRLIKTVIIAFLITSIIGIFEYFIFPTKLKKIKFSLILLVRTILYIIIISFSVIVVWVVHESSVNEVNVFTTLQSEDFRNFILEGDFKSIFIFSIFVSFLFNFFTRINRLLGKNVLLSYLTGKYHNPKKEERAFMFLDLSSSTTIAEKLDPVTYHKFMNNYFFDIDEAIIQSKGEIYQYVGDEVIISWKGKSGFKDANCINCFFDILERIDELSGKYKNQFGVIPGFKAGLHYGNVVTGEIGDSKKEIVFHGDVLNTASRIQSQCNSLGKKFLVSEDVLKRIVLPEEFKSVCMGKFMLRGKQQEVELFSIEKNHNDLTYRDQS